MWNKRDWICTAATAGVAFGLTLATLHTDAVNAIDPVSPAVDIARPSLKFDEITVTARLPDSAEKVVQIASANMPKFQIEVKNAGDASATVKFSADVTSTSAREMFSRVPMPRSTVPQWSHEYTLDLKPGETKVIDATPDFKIEANSFTNIALSAGKEKVAALTLSTMPVAPSTQPAQVVGTVAKADAGKIP